MNLKNITKKELVKELLDIKGRLMRMLPVLPDSGATMDIRRIIKHLETFKGMDDE